MYSGSTRSAATLLWLISSAAALPFQQMRLQASSEQIDLRAQCDAHSLSGMDLPLYSTNTLMKRSPMPPPVEHQSRINEGRLSAQDIQNYRAHQERTFALPEEHIGLMDKAVRSVTKDGIAYIGEKPNLVRNNAMKWLNRGEASILRNEDIITEARQHYLDKMYRKIWRPEEAMRARVKGQPWENLAHYPHNDILADMIVNREARLQGNVHRLESQLFDELKKDTNPELIDGLKQELKMARDAYHEWTLADDESATLMVNKELNLFADASLRSKIFTDPEIKAEMMEHAAKAIAWNMRAKKLNIAQWNELEAEGGRDVRNKRQRM